MLLEPYVKRSAGLPDIFHVAIRASKFVDATFFKLLWIRVLLIGK